MNERYANLADLKKREDQAAQLPPVERLLVINGATLTHSQDSIRVYERKTPIPQTVIVYEGRFDNKAASALSEVAARNHCPIFMFYANGNSVQGVFPKGNYHEKIKNSPISVEIDGEGDLAKMAIREIKAIFEKARQEESGPVPQLCQ